MKRYPKYGEDGFCLEYLYLWQQPKTIADVDRQLACLGELERNGRYANTFMLQKPSKRRTRLLRQYWALMKSAA